MLLTLFHLTSALPLETVEGERLKASPISILKNKIFLILDVSFPKLLSDLSSSLHYQTPLICGFCFLIIFIND